MALTRRYLSAVAGSLLVAVGRTNAQLAYCGSPRAALLGAQATYIGQDLRPFDSPYSGPMSLVSTGDRQLSQSYGAYGGACVVNNLSAYVDVEMIRGSGISRASGLASVTNGDVLRQGSVDLGKGPYLARVFVRWMIPLGGAEQDTIAAGVDVMPGVVAAHRIEVTAGKFALTDLFDLNRYANSTRTQFLDWVLFNSGAWDYAADTRGYSNGIVFAWLTPTWSIRAGSLQMPTFANGNVFDGDVINARGDNVEVTVPAPDGAIIRVLGYVNHGRMGRYAVATSEAAARGTTPDIVADDARGRIKYGFALNGEMPLADSGNTGIFGRLGWNDGRTESFVFTEVDRHASTGLQLSGQHWGREADVLAIAGALEGLSAPHRAYLAAGGRGFLLGDGKLRYGPEILLESYYRVQIGGHAAVSPDIMLIDNPGYNRDRGPATVLTMRVNAHL